MIAGLPWTSWLLIAAATLPALTLALTAYIVHRGEPRSISPE